MKNMKKNLLVTGLALAVAANSIYVTPITAQAAKRTTTVSTTSSVKQLSQVKSNGGVLPTEIYDYKVYSQYPDLQAAFGNNKAAYYTHYLNYGIKEGRTASSQFNVLDYKNAYADLQAAFGEDLVAYIGHYLNYGLQEGRVAIGCAPVMAATQIQTVSVPASVSGATTSSQPVNSSSPADASSRPVEDSSQLAVSNGVFRKDLALKTFEEINAYRAEIGVEPLVWDETIYAGAEIRAKELKTLFDHKRPDGSDCLTVFAGISGEYQPIGEICAVTFDGTSAAQAWYNSKGHRNSMLASRKYYGATAIYYENGQYYSVTNFALSTTIYRYDDSYTLDSWTLSDGTTITAREYDRMKFEVRKLQKEYCQADGTYRYPSQEAEEYLTALEWKFYDALECYFDAGGN